MDTRADQMTLTEAARPMMPISDDVGSEFFKTQLKHVGAACIARFIDRTGNAAVKMAVCMVCGRELFMSDTTDFGLGAIPNSHLLMPFEPHPAHELTDSILLQTTTISETPDGRSGAICDECARNLQKGWLPHLSLANGMWIGEVPFELASLSIPEHVLIARHYPTAYIGKMYPKQKGLVH